MSKLQQLTDFNTKSVQFGYNMQAEDCNANNNNKITIIFFHLVVFVSLLECEYG
jgi:hypothetical protein